MPVNLDQTSDGYLIKTPERSVCAASLCPLCFEYKMEVKKKSCQTEGAVN